MKNLILVVSFVILFGLAFGCKDKAAMAELKQLKTAAAQQEQNKALLRRYFEETDKGNYAAWSEIFSTDYQFHYPSSAKPITLEERMQISKSLHAAFPDFKHTIEDIFAMGDKAVVRATLTGTHTGDFMGIPATGKSVKSSAIVMARFSEGKIVEMWLEADFMGLFQQLGMELKPKEAEKK